MTLLLLPSHLLVACITLVEELVEEILLGSSAGPAPPLAPLPLIARAIFVSVLVVGSLTLRALLRLLLPLAIGLLRLLELFERISGASAAGAIKVMALLIRRSTSAEGRLIPAASTILPRIIIITLLAFVAKNIIRG